MAADGDQAGALPGGLLPDAEGREVLLQGSEVLCMLVQAGEELPPVIRHESHHTLPTLVLYAT
jgi:hypothetical protein